MTCVPITIRITYTVLPRGYNGLVTRISCGPARSAEVVQDWLYRYARYAASNFLGATIRQGADGSLVVVRTPADVVLATITVEPTVDR